MLEAYANVTEISGISMLRQFPGSLGASLVKSVTGPLTWRAGSRGGTDGRGKRSRGAAGGSAYRDPTHRACASGRRTRSSAHLPPERSELSRRTSLGSERFHEALCSEGRDRKWPWLRGWWAGQTFQGRKRVKSLRRPGPSARGHLRDPFTL